MQSSWITRNTIPLVSNKAKRKRQVGKEEQDTVESEMSEASTDSSDSNTESETESTLSAESLKLFRIILQNAELGYQKVTKYCLIRLIQDSDPDPSDDEGEESSDEEEVADQDDTSDEEAEHEELTPRQISCLKLIVKSARGKSNTLTKSMLINFVQNVQ
jgi:hypothetical protein